MYTSFRFLLHLPFPSKSFAIHHLSGASDGVVKLRTQDIDNLTGIAELSVRALISRLKMNTGKFGDVKIPRPAV
jgi:hypothetical protein